MGDNWITLKKMGIEFLNVFLSAGLAGLISYVEAQATLPTFAMALILLRGLENWWKHRNDRN